MKRSIIFLCIGLFIFLVVQPNLNQSFSNRDIKVPEKDPAKVITNADLLNQTCKSQATICIDPARGGEDYGYTSTGHIAEKDINLKIAQALGKELEQSGYQVIYTRTDDNISQYDSELAASQARLALAKESGADYLISIQQSSDTNSLIQGFSLFTQPDEKVSQLAKGIAFELREINFTQFEGIDNDHYSNFPILSDRDLPSVIVDLGYLSNTDDYEKLADEEYQNKIGKAIAAAFLKEVN